MGRLQARRGRDGVLAIRFGTTSAGYDDDLMLNRLGAQSGLRGLREALGEQFEILQAVAVLDESCE